MPVISLLRAAIDLWVARHAFQHAAALAFYTLISLAPLTIILAGIGGVVFGEDAARGEIARAIGEVVGEQAAEAVEEAVRRSRTEEAGILPTLLGIGALLFGATAVFAQAQSSLNQFWGVIAKPSRSGVLVFLTTRLISFGMVLVLGFLLLASFVLSLAISAILLYAEHWVSMPAFVIAGGNIAASLLLATVVFGMMFKVLPDVQLRWRDVWRAALLTAVLFVIGEYLISYYLTRAAPASTYGAAGSLVMLLLWVYYSSLILFFGTAVAKVAILRRDGAVTPKSTAVRANIVVHEQSDA